MSWWIYKKDKDGKVYLISTDVTSFILLSLVLLGLFAAILLPNLLRSSPLGMVQFFLWGGFACLLAAKTSLFRQGILVVVGAGSNEQTMVARVQNRIYSHRSRGRYDDRGISRNPLTTE
jgi:F0F1-type ATP synthase assembly protein I